MHWWRVRSGAIRPRPRMVRAMGSGGRGRTGVRTRTGPAMVWLRRHRAVVLALDRGVSITVRTYHGWGKRGQHPGISIQEPTFRTPEHQNTRIPENSSTRNSPAQGRNKHESMHTRT